MKHVSLFILAIFLVMSHNSVTNSQTDSTDDSSPASNWLQQALSNILDKSNAGNDNNPGLMVNGSVRPRKTSQAMYSVINSDGTSTTTTYNTDSDGVVHTNTFSNDKSLN